MQKILVHPEWGPIVYKKNKRSKRLTIRVNDEGVVVTLPWATSYAEARALLEQKRDWLRQALQHRSARLDARRLGWDTTFEVLGRPLTITPGIHIAVQGTPEDITITFPPHTDWHTDGAQQQLQAVLIEVLRREAKAYLPTRTRVLAAQHGVPIHKIFIKNVKTRWGSCSNRGNINLSLHLMLLPESWIDYVIVHELAHIRHPDHSPAFWAHLEAMLPGAQAIDRQLRGYERPF